MPRTAKKVEERRGLPIKEFLYTLDQVCYLLAIPMNRIERHVRFTGGNFRQDSRARMGAINLIVDGAKNETEWRVPESEVLAYMKARGFAIYERKLR